MLSVRTRLDYEFTNQIGEGGPLRHGNGTLHYTILHYRTCAQRGGPDGENGVNFLLPNHSPIHAKLTRIELLVFGSLLSACLQNR